MCITVLSVYVYYNLNNRLCVKHTLDEVSLVFNLQLDSAYAYIVCVVPLALGFFDVYNIFE